MRWQREPFLNLRRVGLCSFEALHAGEIDQIDRGPHEVLEPILVWQRAEGLERLQWHIEARFLADLARGGLLARLACLDDAARQPEQA